MESYLSTPEWKSCFKKLDCIWIKLFLISGMTKLLVGTGSNAKSNVEVINLDKDDPFLICEDLTKFPLVIDVLGATGQLLNGNIPIICGGTRNECDCYTYQSNSWKSTPNPTECRKFASSATLKVADEKEVLILAGGADKSKIILKSVESFNGTVWDNQQFEDLPEAVSGNCIVKINSSVLLSIGGVGENSTPTKSTFFFDAHVNKWTPGPSINIPRNGLSCGLLKWTKPDSDQSSKIVVVVGGQTDGEFEPRFLDSVELLYLDDYDTPNGQWITGPELPRKSFEAQLIEYKNSVILVGGGVDQQTNFYELSSPEGPWVVMRQSLKADRSYHVAFLVPDEIVNCHK